MAATGSLNQATIAGYPLAGMRVTPMASSNSDASGSQSTKNSSAGITANDFLTLLVTEMKNQDPTANTDPNEYINQLVNVNSLQQLISINETLTGALGSSNVNVNATPATQAAATNRSSSNSTASGKTAIMPTDPTPSSPDFTSAACPTIQALLSKFTHGNLSVPDVSPAANRLAHALDGRTGVLPLAK